MKLSEDHIRIWDEDTPTSEVWVEVQHANGVRLTDRHDLIVRRFNLAQFLNGKVGVFVV